MTTLTIDGMTCQHCVRAVRNALMNVPGVVGEPVIDLQKGTAVIEGSASRSALVEAIESEGYTVHPEQKS